MKCALCLFVLGIVALVGIVLFAAFAMWWGLNINIQVQNVGSILATLILTAGFIERAVEVIITPWRDPGWDRLNTKATGPAATDEDKNKLKDYVAVTTRCAFTAAMMFGLVAAMVGVRALWPFIAAEQQTSMVAFKSATVGQQNTFIVLDVILSAALMAGGANGIHSVVTLVTTAADVTEQKVKNSVKA
jgi:hypothetical protein